MISDEDYEDLFNMAKSFQSFSSNKTLSKLIKEAAPFSSYEFENIHDKEIRDAIKQQKNKEVVVYHGTSSKKLAEIISHGSLDPSKSIENRVHVGKNGGTGSSFGIFVTNKPYGFTGAEMYAHTSATNDTQGDDSNPVILELVVPFNWIDVDPDDTKYKENGEMNDFGKSQGVIRKPIPLNRIKQVLLNGPEIQSIDPRNGSNIFDANSTNWIPFGTFVEKLKKQISKGKSFPEEYNKIVENSPKRLSKQEPKIEYEEVLAKGLVNLYDNFFDPSDRVYKKALLTVLNNKNKSALDVIKEFLGDKFEEFKIDNPYPINGYEGLFYYLKRAGYISR